MRSLRAHQPDFHPHGISLFRAADGSLTLMAVNHISPTQHAVDIFEVKIENGAATLNEIGDIQSDKLLSPNDVAAVGKEQFYVTNDHGSHTPFGQTLENYLMLPRADVLYFDGSVFKEVAAGLVFANGIALSNDGNRVYVAESTARRIQTFGRDLFSGKLTPQNTFDLPSGPDNIDVDEKGDLWIAAHPKMFALVALYERSVQTLAVGGLQAQRQGRHPAIGNAGLCESRRADRRGEHRRGGAGPSLHRLDLRSEDSGLPLSLSECATSHLFQHPDRGASGLGHRIDVEMEGLFEYELAR